MSARRSERKLLSTREGNDDEDGDTGSREVSGCANEVSILKATELICYGVDIWFESEEKQRWKLYIVLQAYGV